MPRGPSTVGSVHRYDSSSGTRYRATYRKPDHSQGTKRGFSTKRAAQTPLQLDSRVTINQMRSAAPKVYLCAAREFPTFFPILARADCGHPVEVTGGCSAAIYSTSTICRSTTASPGSKATFPSLPCFPLVFLYFSAPELCISRPLLTCGTVCAQLVESLAHVLSIAHALATAQSRAQRRRRLRSRERRPCGRAVRFLWAMARRVVCVCLLPSGS